MTEQQSAFDRKNLETIDPTRSRDLLDELNLPKSVEKSIRRNAGNLKIAGVCLVVLVLAWVFFDYYSQGQREKAASQLAEALRMEDDASRSEALTRLQSEYSGSDAALWGTIELAHIDNRAARYDDALSRYLTVSKEISASSPLYPLVELGLAQTYERKNDVDNAIIHYRELTKIEGFTGVGYGSLGRLYESRKDLTQAGEAYKNYLKATADQPGTLDSTMVEEKLARYGISIDLDGEAAGNN